MADEKTQSVDDFATALEEAMSTSDKKESAPKEEDLKLEDPGDAEDSGEDEGASEEDSEAESSDEKILQALKDEEGEVDDEDEVDDEEYDATLSPTLADINKKFPTLLKEFPQLGAVLENEKKFAEIFESPEAAKEALEKSQIATNLETLLTAGDSRTLLNALYNTNTEAGNRFVHNFLPTIKGASTDLYLKVVAPAISEFLMESYREAKKLDNDILRKSAENLLRFNFNGRVVPWQQVDPQKLLSEGQKGPSETETKVLNARQDEVAERLAQHTDKILTRELETALSKLEAFQKFPKFSQSTLLTNIIKDIDTTIKRDPAFVQTMNNAIAQARKNAYTKPYTDRVLKLYMDKARSVLPKIRNKHALEALNVSSKRPEKKKEIKAAPKQQTQSAKVAATTKEGKNIGNNVGRMTEFLT